MYIRPFTAILSLVALAGAVVAAPNALEARQLADQECPTGPVQCCNQTLQAPNSLLTLILGLLGVNAGGITGLAGIDCLPVVGPASSCSQQPVCCTGNTYEGGLVVLACNSINL